MEGKDKKQLQEGFKISVYNIRPFLNACMTGADLNTVTKGGNFQILFNNMLTRARYVSWCEILHGNRIFTQLEQLKSSS